MADDNVVSLAHKVDLLPVIVESSSLVNGSSIVTSSKGCLLTDSLTQEMISQNSKHTEMMSFNLDPLVMETNDQEKVAARIEAEYDEMARYIGPVAKSLFTPVVAPLVDANSFADALGVAPLYKQKESQRWSSALNFYRQISAQDQSGNSLYQPMSRTLEEDESLLDKKPAANNSDESVTWPTIPSPSAAPVLPTTVRQQSRNQNGVGKTLGSSIVGFMTPPPMSLWSANHTSANYIVSPPRRKSSSVSPGEASLNSLELEAIAAVHELQFAVKDIYVSEMLPRTSELIFLNVTTLEGQAYCVELTLKGWRVTSLRHDCMNGDIDKLDLHTQYFETIYALMDRISPDYRQRFTDALMSKLAAIQSDRKSDIEDQTKTIGEEIQKCCSGEGKAEERLDFEQRQTFT